MERLAPAARIFRFGVFEADAGRSALNRGGLRVRLQDQPFRVLILLLERPGEVITREELRQQLWPEGTHVDFDGSLNVILKKLRAALDDDSDNPRFIETVPRRGYRFIAPVTVDSSTVTSPTSANGVVLGGVAELSNDRRTTASDMLRGPRPLHLIVIYVVSAVALLAVFGLGWYVRRDSVRMRTLSVQRTAANVPVRKSVAVLGFHNLSGKVDDGWLATAFSEMLSTELAAGEKLRLVSGEEVANLRLSSPWSQTDTLGQETTARIGAALNSDVLVLGSYTSIGKPERRQLRVDVRLQDAKTGEIFSEVAEIGSSQDFFHLISRIGAKFRDRLGVPSVAEIDEPSVLASLPSNPEALRFYTLGLAKLRDYDALAAKDLLEQAIKADPKSPLAHATLARSWEQLGYEQRRKQEAKQALDLSAHLPRVNRMLVEGDYYESLAQHEKAASTYQALFVLFPDSVEYGLQLATAQIAASHGSLALETLAQLRKLPLPASADPRIDLTQARIGTNKPAALALIRAALGKATSQGRKLVYAQARRQECLALIYSDHPEQGVPACEDAYKIFLAAGNRLGAADSVRLIGDSQGYGGHFEQAIATYQRALNILQELGEHKKIGAVLNNMAINFTSEGNLDRAEQFYRQAKRHFEQAGDNDDVAIALGNIADILYLRGNLRAASSLYEQTLDLEASLDPSDPGYTLYRLADLELAEGHVAVAHQRAQQAVDLLRPVEGGYQYLTGAMLVLGEAMESEGDLKGARQQYQQALEIRQKTGELSFVAENQVTLAHLCLEEGHPEESEPLLRAAIAEFEKEKGNPDAASAYTLLSRTLLTEGKLEEARKAIQHAAGLGRNSPDPALTLPLAIQNERIEIAAAPPGSAGRLGLATAIQRLRSAAATARKLGYYQIECEARLASAVADLKANPALGRSQLEVLEKETHERGLELVSRKAQLLVSADQPLPVHR